MALNSDYQPTDVELQAIRSYAEQMGRTWKSKLIIDWSRSGSRTLYQGEWAPLQHLRNQLGISWLNRFKL